MPDKAFLFNFENNDNPLITMCEYPSSKSTIYYTYILIDVHVVERVLSLLLPKLIVGLILPKRNYMILITTLYIRAYLKVSVRVFNAVFNIISARIRKRFSSLEKVQKYIY